MKLHHVAISVPDMEKSQRFYEKHFRLKEVLRFRRDDLRVSGVMLESEGTLLEILQADEQKPSTDDAHNLGVYGLKHIAFLVDDIETISQRLRDAGITVPEPLEGKKTHILYFTDPDGIVVELYYYKRESELHHVSDDRHPAS